MSQNDAWLGDIDGRPEISGLSIGGQWFAAPWPTAARTAVST